MSHNGIVKLDEYLALHAVKQKDFAQMIGESATNVSRYCCAERTPRPDVMRKIYDATGGLVDANSFFDLPVNSPAAESDTVASVSGSDSFSGENAALEQNIVAPNINIDQGRAQ